MKTVKAKNALRAVLTAEPSFAFVGTAGSAR